MTDQLDRLRTALAERYVVEREIGSGGMATVYLAEDLKHGRHVAIKVLRSELAAVLGAERFLKEIKVTANLQHPHILPLYDSGEAEGFLYYVMPYVEGESLRDRMDREGQLPLEDALRIAREVASALSYAHSHDVIHRDVKPENVLLSTGEAVVTDFGIARAISEAGGQRLTETGMSVGTPLYMSPEQASGVHHLDGRSDLYSLGCVLYEMLAGEPPYTGATVQALIAKKLGEPAPRVSVLRETVPETVTQAVQKVLAKAPADRFATATDLIAALGSAPVTSSLPPTHRRPFRIVALAVGVAVVGIGAVTAYLTLSRPSIALDSNLLAVAPFDVLSQNPELAIWGEGLMDLLSRNLDGAGPIRTLPPTIAVRRWEGRADAASARSLGQRTGAGLAVYGTLVGVEGDSARVAVTLLDVGSATVIAETEFRERTDRMDMLADTLAVRLLRELGGRRAMGALPLSSIGSRSPAAIRAFLTGEQHYRRSQWDSARVFYERAIALDSAFGLAYRRVGLVLGWSEEGFGMGSRALSALQARAATLGRGLAPRESLLVLADSLEGALTWSVFDGDWSRIERLFGTLEYATERFPEDPEVWYQLGEARYHFGTSIGVTPDAVRSAFERAIELDSGFAPAYLHTIELDVMLDGAAAAVQTLDGLLALRPAGVELGAALLTRALLDPARAASVELQAMLDTLTDDVLERAVVSLGRLPDSAESALRVARVLAARSPAGLASVGRLLGHRGHLEAASETLRRLDWVRPFPNSWRVWLAQGASMQLAMLGAVPQDTVEPVLAAWLAQEYTVGFYLAFPYWADHRDTVRLAEAVRVWVGELDRRRLAQSADSGISGWGRDCALAYLSLARGDTVNAVRAFEVLRDWPGVPGAYVHRLTLAGLFESIGRDADAARVLEQMADSWYAPGPFEVIWVLDRARVNDRLGHREKAVRDYAYVVDAWHRADHELQPFVEESRSALVRLSGERR